MLIWSSLGGEAIPRCLAFFVASVYNMATHIQKIFNSGKRKLLVKL